MPRQPRRKQTAHNDSRRASPEVKALLKAYRNPARFFITLATGFSMAGGLCLVGGAWCLAVLVDGVIFGQAALGTLKYAMVGLCAFYILHAVFSALAERAGFKGAAAVKAVLRNRLIDRFQARSIRTQHDFQTGAALNAAIEGVDALHVYYSRYLPALAVTVFLPLAILVFVYPTDWISGVIMTLTAPLIPLFMILIGLGAERLNRRQWRRLAYLSGHFLDAIQGLTTIKLFNASRREARLMEKICDDFRLDTMAVLRVAFLSSLVLEFFATVSIAVVAVLIGFRLLWGEVDFLHGFFVLLLAPEFYLPLRRMGTFHHARMEAVGAAEKVAALLSGEDGAQDEERRYTSLPEAKAVSLRFEGVSYAYGEGRDAALIGLDFELSPGCTVALVGPSGSGKTTLQALALGLIQPQAGRIVANGVDLTVVDPATWRDRLAWMPQRPTLFSGTVIDNIRMGNPGLPDDALRALAAELQIADLLDRRTGEKGVGLSGGQIQRVALARALARDPALLVLDEPTASLDEATEVVIQAALTRHGAGRSVLVAAHRLGTIRNADMILLLDRGRIVDRGTHEALKGSSAYYRACLDGLDAEEARA